VKTFSSNSLINNERTPQKEANPRRRAKAMQATYDAITALTDAFCRTT